ncbi:MAG TPA: trypsin-like peptidase domain-containing protein [Candidatus Acidoferrales bacterium]|nr:trypsin-like peptidase domain-containing protein [Candidatus Acidoferrales bacterium]
MCSATAARPGDAALPSAVCSIVYPVDQTPSDRGYRYLFYGNGFFINDQGYLVTAAHVLSRIRGGQPYIVLPAPSGPARLLRADVAAVDPDHDVVVLRATPNPFEGGLPVAYLPLSPAWLAPQGAVFVASRHPTDPLHSWTSDAIVDDRSPGQVFDLQFSQLYRNLGLTELYLFTPQVRPGQSGAPVLSADSRAVVGFVEGQWLRSSVIQLGTDDAGETSGVAAAVPVHYVIALLESKGIAWHFTPAAATPAGSAPAANAAFSPPAPLSLVAAPFPSNALFGGEVVLDALIDAHGRVSETRTARGDSPLLDSALTSLRTWVFSPARLAGQPIPARVGITFEFVQSREPLRAPPAQQHDDPFPAAPDRSALPVFTVEPRFPSAPPRDGSVILSAVVGSDGRLGPLKVLMDSESLAPAATASVEQWRFLPARRARAASPSLEIVIVVYRFSGAPHPASPSLP